VALRKQHLSIYDIHDALTQQGHALSLTAIHEVVRAEGFGRLPRRRDEDRPQRPRPDRAAVADVRQCRVTPRRVPTALGGLFVFLPWLVALDLDGLVAAAGLPGTKMIPAAHALRAALALKLTSTERRSHVMDLVFDEGLALWTGLNVVPKTTFLSQYSSRLGPRRLAALLDGWVRTVRAQQLLPGRSFNLDFHSIPFFGADEFIEKHYVSRRSRRQKSVLAFLAQDADTRVLCYLQRRPAQGRGGRGGPGLRAVLDPTNRPAPAAPGLRLATHHLCHAGEAARPRGDLHHLARRSPALLREMALLPRSAWRTVHLDVPHRLYQTPKVIDQRIRLREYPDPLRQLFITDLGHEHPTVLLTNDLRSTPAALIIRYARRMLIENGARNGRHPDDRLLQRVERRRRHEGRGRGLSHQAARSLGAVGRDPARVGASARAGRSGPTCGSAPATHHRWRACSARRPRWPRCAVGSSRSRGPIDRARPARPC